MAGLTDAQNVRRLYEDLKQRWERKREDWYDISKFVGIRVDTDYRDRLGGSSDDSRDLDNFIDDPTAAISVDQGGDYLLGVMWGTGQDVLDLIPSRHVTELVDEATVEEWYKYATEQTLFHMNHSSAGFVTALKQHTYDQFAFGTSGIGTFKNIHFESGVDDNALVFCNYGIDNTMIDEGRGGQPDIVFSTHKWKLNRIIGEFATIGGEINDAALAKLPEQIKKAYEGNDFNQEFLLVFGVFPREDFNPKFKGKRGTRYRGVWFLDDDNEGKIFFQEDFAEKPIAIARAIKVRGETYGRAAGTMLISTIRSVNFMVGTAIEIVDKMSNPAMGLTNNAIMGDGVLDTSPDSLTIFNMSAIAGNTDPVFPLHDVGDPAAILNFLVPYLNEKVVTAFKIDALLDFSSAKEMTATESLQRFAIRGKSLAGMLLQQKNEGLIPWVKRSVSLLQSMRQLGIDPRTDQAQIEKLRPSIKSSRVIPEAVLEVMESGKPWFEIRFNNELEKLVRTENIEALIQMINAITAVAALNPDIVAAIDWYKLLKDINDNLDYNSQIMIPADEFKAQVEQAAQMQQQAMMLQAGQAGAQIQKDTASANKSNSEAIAQ